jgi:asparagine synthase (glutamine-hydrolysing)
MASDVRAALVDLMATPTRLKSREEAVKKLSDMQLKGRYLQVQHSILEVDTAEFDADLHDFFDAMDQPTIDGLNTWFVSKAARHAGLKVALSGLGGDELLGGYWTSTDIPAAVGRHAIVRQIPFAPTAYRWFTEQLGSRYVHQNPKESARFMFPDSYGGAYAVERGLIRPWQLPALIDRDLLDAGTEALRTVLAIESSDGFDSLPPLGKVMVLEDAHYMRNQLLRDSDWAGMAQSLEIRVPLVDRSLTEHVAGLAALGRLGNNKSALGQVLQPGLPAGILNRAKTGFTLPLWQWLRKSDEAQIWKSNPLLRKSHLRDPSRWAFTVLTKAGHCQVRHGLLSVS